MMAVIDVNFPHKTLNLFSGAAEANTNILRETLELGVLCGVRVSCMGVNK